MLARDGACVDHDEREAGGRVLLLPVCGDIHLLSLHASTRTMLDRTTLISSAMRVKCMVTIYNLLTYMFCVEIR